MLDKMGEMEEELSVKAYFTSHPVMATDSYQPAPNLVLLIHSASPAAVAIFLKRRSDHVTLPFETSKTFLSHVV